MLSKNNLNEKIRQASEGREHFSIRKLSVGAVSILLGLSFLQAGNNQIVHADTISTNSSQVVKTNQEQTANTQNQTKAPETDQVEQVKTKVQNFRSQQTAMTSQQRLQTVKSLQSSLTNLSAEETARLAAQLNVQPQNNEQDPQTLIDIEKQHHNGTYGQAHEIQDYNGSLSKNSQLYNKTNYNNDPKITDIKVKDVYLMTGQNLEDTVGSENFKDLVTAKVNGQTLKAGVDQKLNAFWGGLNSLTDDQIAYLNQLNRGVAYSSSDYYDTNTHSFDKAGTYYLPLTLHYCPVADTSVSYTAVIAKVTVGLADNVQYQPGYEYDNGLQNSHTLPMNRVVNTNNGTVHAGESITIKPQYQEKQFSWNVYDQNQPNDYRYGFNSEGREGYLLTNPAAEYEIPTSFSDQNFTAAIDAHTGAITIRTNQNAKEGIYTIPVNVTYQDGSVDKISPAFFIAHGNDQVVWGNHGRLPFNGQYNDATVFKFKKITDHYITRDIDLPKVLFSDFEKDDILSGVEEYQADLGENFAGNSEFVVFGSPVDISDDFGNNDVMGYYDGDNSKKFVVSINDGGQYHYVLPVDIREAKAIDGVKVKQGTDLSRYTTTDLKKLINTTAYDGVFKYTLEWKPKEQWGHQWIASGMPNTDKPGKQDGIIRINFAKNNTSLDVPVSLMVVAPEKPNNQQKPNNGQKPDQKPVPKPQTQPATPTVDPSLEKQTPSQPEQDKPISDDTNEAPLSMDSPAKTDTTQENSDQQSNDTWSETSPVHGPKLNKSVKHHQSAQKPAKVTNHVKGRAPEVNQQAVRINSKKPTKASLPATGEKDVQSATIIGLAIAGVASLLGLAGSRKIRSN